jgi:hypothetical protein
MATLTVLATAAPAWAGVTKDETSVYTLPGFALVEGASMDARITAGGVNISAHTNGLTGGNAYTLWSVSFSHPEHCSHGNEAMGLLDPSALPDQIMSPAGGVQIGFFVP